MAIILDEIWQVSVGDDDAGAIDLGPYLDVNELAATVQVSELDTNDLTISNVAVSTTELEILGETVPIAKAVQFTFLGMVVGAEYFVGIEITTDSTPSRIKNYCQRIQTAPDC